jgi:hypothetical protein
MSARTIAFLAAFFWLVVSQESVAFAYLGPGVGLGAIGVVLGVIGSILLAILAFIWYPIKRAWKAVMRKASKPSDPIEPDA